MADDFQAPRLGISRVYTRTGDDGRTALVGGQRVPKDDPRIAAYGTVDELNAVAGLCRAACQDGAPLAPLTGPLLRVQHQLFNLGSVLATLPADVGPRQPRVRPADVAWLEQEMDRANASLGPLRSFVLPGCDRTNGLFHLARTVCRRAERETVRLQREAGGLEDEVRYLNRLSDALFVWSRWAAWKVGAAETLWDPNQA